MKQSYANVKNENTYLREELEKFSKENTAQHLELIQLKSRVRFLTTLADTLTAKQDILKAEIKRDAEGVPNAKWLAEVTMIRERKR